MLDDFCNLPLEAISSTFCRNHRLEIAGTTGTLAVLQFFVSNTATTENCNKKLNAYLSTRGTD